MSKVKLNKFKYSIALKETTLTQHTVHLKEKYNGSESMVLHIIYGLYYGPI